MSKTPSKRRHWHNDPWKYLYSLNTGVTILVILAVACIYATIKYKDLSDAQEHVYKSFNFLLLLIALGTNMTLATIRIVFDKILPMMRVRVHDKPDFFKTRKPAQTVAFSGTVAQVNDAFRAKGFKTRVQNNFGYAWKGKLSLWGAPVSHTGMVLVLITGLLSFLWLDQEGSITLIEGQQTDFRLDMAGYKEAQQNSDFNEHWSQMVSQASYADIKSIVDKSGSSHDLSYFLDVFKPLGYTIRCEDFETGFHPRSRIISKYISTVTSLDADPPLLSEIVEVNRSVAAGGWILHQSSYKEIDDPRATRYLLQMENTEIKDKETGKPLSMEMEITPGQTRLIPGIEKTEMSLESYQPFRWTITDASKKEASGTLMGGTGQGFTLKVEQFEPDFLIGENRTFTSRSRDLNNPAAKVSLVSGGETLVSRWLFQREDMKKMFTAGGGMHSADEEGLYDLEFVSVSGTDPGFSLAINVTEAGKPATTYNLKPGGSIQIAAPAKMSAPTDPGAWKISMIKRVPMYSTTLSMTRNPMVPVIYFACFLMILGLCIAFMINRKEIWFWVDDKSNRQLHVVGRYRYARESMDPAVARVMKQLGDAQPTSTNEAETDTAK